MTDDQRLFRVVASSAAAASGVVTLEDCATLEVRGYTLPEIEGMRLRAVRGEASFCTPAPKRSETSRPRQRSSPIGPPEGGIWAF